jgi:hypothetical protein
LNPKLRVKKKAPRRSLPEMKLVAARSVKPITIVRAFPVERAMPQTYPT